MSDLPGPGQNRFDAVERLRRKLEGMRAAEAGTSKVARLPRHPRRVTEDGERPHKTWHPESVYDSAPTRPVLRSELQGETGAWPVGSGTAPHPTSDDESAEQDSSVVDLDALRRKRAGEGVPTGGIRRMRKPRRIRPDTP